MEKSKQETQREYVNRNLAEFSAGMLALKQSQENTDARIEKLLASQAKTDARILEIQESEKRGFEKLRASQDKTDAQMRKTEKALEEAIRTLNRVTKNLGDMGFVQGQVAEDLFYRNVKGLFRPLNWRFKRVRRNVKIKGYGEYDIVADEVEAQRVLVIEIKNKLERKMVDDFMNKKLPRFKTLLPEYRDRQMLAGVGALVVQDSVGRYAERAGLFVLTQSIDGGAALMNRKNFKPREFE